ncbi:hypothetical protein GW17_00010874 [Ensete ventricosum]|nr:hypothetical protein GW17_00010874 [Ensete ventricosum]RZR81452.1 hypothetical protein BHM03_00007678 [Ensete ventricosum]
MRLNRVESFHAFLLCFRSKRSEEEDGRLAMARSPIVPGHLQGDSRLWPRDDWLRPRAPTQGVAGYRAVLATRPQG